MFTPTTILTCHSEDFNTCTNSIVSWASQNCSEFSPPKKTTFIISQPFLGTSLWKNGVTSWSLPENAENSVTEGLVLYQSSSPRPKADPSEERPMEPVTIIAFIYPSYLWDIVNMAAQKIWKFSALHAYYFHLCMTTITNTLFNSVFFVRRSQGQVILHVLRITSKSPICCIYM